MCIFKYTIKNQNKMKKLFFTLCIIGFVQVHAQVKFGIITHSKSNGVEQAVDIEKVSSSGIVGSTQGTILLSNYSPTTGSIGVITNPNNQSRISLDYYNFTNGLVLKKTICNTGLDAASLSSSIKFSPKQIKRVSNGYAICGYYRNDSVALGKDFGFLLKVDNNCNVVFFKRYQISGNSNLYFNSLAPIANGNGYLLVGARTFPGYATKVADILQVDANGAVIKNTYVTIDSTKHSEFVKIIERDSSNFIMVGFYGQSEFSGCITKDNLQASDILFSTYNIVNKTLLNRVYKNSNTFNIEKGIDLVRDNITTNTYVVSNYYYKPNCPTAANDYSILLSSINTANLTNPATWAVNWTKKIRPQPSTLIFAKEIIFQGAPINQLFVYSNFNTITSSLVNSTTAGVINPTVETYTGNLFNSQADINSCCVDINNTGNIEMFGSVKGAFALNLFERAGVTSGPAPCFQVPKIDSVINYTFLANTILSDSILVTGVNENYFSVNHVVTLDSSCNGFPSNKMSTNKSAVEINSNFTIYPNPVTSQLILEFASDINKTLAIEVFDMLGNKVITKELHVITGNNKLELDMHVLHKGIYYVRINDAYNRQVLKIIKE